MAKWQPLSIKADKITEMLVEDGQVHIRERQNVDNVLYNAKTIRDRHILDDGFKDFRPLAVIPMVKINQWKREGFDYFDPDMDRTIRAKMLRIKLKECPELLTSNKGTKWH